MGSAVASAQKCRAMSPVGWRAQSVFCRNMIRRWRRFARSCTRWDMRKANIRIEQRFANRRMEGLPQLADELVQMKVKVLTGERGFTAGPRCRRPAPFRSSSSPTTTIPSRPALIGSTNRPGGNVLESFAPGRAGRQAPEIAQGDGAGPARVCRTPFLTGPQARATKLEDLAAFDTPRYCSFGSRTGREFPKESGGRQ